MIHIYGKYYAVAYEHGYILKKDNGKNDKGETKWQDLGYYGRLESVVNAAFDSFLKNKLSKKTSELAEVITEIQKTRELFRKVLGGLENV